ncbi:MAG TPA: helix-turn-helix transcriptional regulator [Myxococcota bacterium]|nr:helix-turn-helix transcriptional regulator [Myxococcota bacterium]
MSTNDDEPRVPLPAHDFAVHLVEEGVAVIAFDLEPVDASPLEALTSGQRRVVELALRGLPDRAIAAQLGLSRHTVSNHLRRAYGRLGVASRNELCALLSTR